jgi:5'-nucleotidase
MRVLLTNDDGFHANGLQALACALRARGDTVWIVAPSANRSGTSCALTLDRPIAVTPYSDHSFIIDGTPADCIHIALTGLASVADFDIVLSGMNDGANLGDDAIHSGTIGAAIQANLYGLPALACSLVERGWAHLDIAVQCTLLVLDDLYQLFHTNINTNININTDTNTNNCFLWNLNIPNQPTLPKVVPAFIGRRMPSKPVLPILSPKGNALYWIGQGGDVLPEIGNDMAVVAAGQAALTPITLDRTDYRALQMLTR